MSRKERTPSNGSGPHKAATNGSVRPEAAAETPPESTPDAAQVEESRQEQESWADTDVQTLFARLHGPLEALRHGDRESLRDHLVLLHAPLVEHCARNFLASGEPLDDLVQEGYVGLIKAVDRFDADKGVRFSTYACHLITGEIRHYLRDLGRLIHEPGWHFELRQRISRTNDQLTQKLGRAPEPEDIARSLGIEASSVRDVLRNQQVLAVEYLDAESDRDGDEGSGTGDWDYKLSGAASTPGAAETRVEDQMVLGAALPHLRDLEKRAVTMFFFEDHTKTEIARRLDISVNHAAYLIKRGLEGLRHVIDASETPGSPAEVGTLQRRKRAAQEQTRAAYLLEMAKTGLAALEEETPAAPAKATGARGRPGRRPGDAKSLAAAVPASKISIASFAEFTLWVDEEARRAARYAQEFSLLWLRVLNWDEAIETLGEQEKRRALADLQSSIRRCCRATDKIATLSTGEIPGLHYLVLLPHTGAAGELIGQRWLEVCREPQFLAEHFADENQPSALKAKYAFALFPQDGKTADTLFRTLGERLGT